MSNQVYFLKVVDDTGARFYVNLDSVAGVQLPSVQPGRELNLNVEIWNFTGGEVQRMPIGTFDAAIAELFAEYSMGPPEFQPENLIKIQSTISPP